MPRKNNIEEEKKFINFKTDDIELNCRNSVLNMLQNRLVKKLRICHWVGMSLVTNKRFLKTHQYESYVFFKTQNEFQRLYLVLEGSDLYCYSDENRTKQKFMHSMINCHIKCDESLLVPI